MMQSRRHTDQCGAHDPASAGKLHKLETLELLTAGLVHDLNNVLSVVSGALDVARFSAVEAKQKAFFDRGHSSVKLASKIIHQLMSFASAAESNPEFIDLAKFREESSFLFESAVGNSPTLLFENESKHGIVADFHGLQSAILNLVINARDATPASGTITVFARDLDDGQVSIGVRDTGEGMTSEVRRSALEAYFTTKPIGRGTGLGLSMVNEFAQNNRAELSIASAPNQGTTVSLIFPREVGLSEELVEPSQKIDHSMNAKYVILVVEDNGPVREVLIKYLENLNYGVIGAADSQSAIEIFGRSERIDLLVTDIAMHGIDGMALAARLQSQKQHLPVLFITGDVMRQRLGTNIVLEKPFTQADLASRVAAALRPEANVTFADYLESRIRHPRIRNIYDKWRSNTESSVGPYFESFKRVIRQELPYLVILAVRSTEPFTYDLVHSGEILNAAIGLTGVDQNLAILELNDAYREVIDSRQPSYEFVRFDLGGSRPVRIERLILPCRDPDDDAISGLVCAFVIEELYKTLPPNNYSGAYLANSGA